MGDVSNAPVTRHKRDPPTFSSMELEDVDDWRNNETISCPMTGITTTKLNIISYHSRIAKTWFLNHEADLHNWVTFTARFRDLFGRPVQRTTEAHQKLAYQVQQEDKSYTLYIEDVLALCNCVHPKLTQGGEDSPHYQAHL